MSEEYQNRHFIAVGYFLSRYGERVDERTGEKIVKENDIHSDVKITESVPVGRYGVRFNFTDPSPGAGAGIYTFSFLRKLGEDAAQNSAFDA